MKTLHAIEAEPTFLEYMQLRFEGIHEDWHYRGTQVWFRPYIGATNHTELGRNMVTGIYEPDYRRWLANGAPQPINRF